ncbi:MAG: SNF2 helicase-associated domain-containing protein, partial [Spirochaetaceae bacterium]|nr:SNF2 helicase-associated domain-containing protein [Spirochaetaceae bacterium]
MGVRLTPAGHLRWEPEPAAEKPASGLAPVLDAFRSDWRGALFTLAAEKPPAQEIPCLRYWQRLAEHYLTGLCHLPEDAEQAAVEPPGDALLSTWALNAPPMEGGEYLSTDLLRRLWEQLDAWVRDAAASAGGVAALLRARAPRWRQVGRVCFHLAENRNDAERPFAFLATYASGFGAGGRLKHLPLRNALQQYAGARDRAALINLLSPVEEAAKACDWVRELADSGDLYRPLAWTPEHAYRFLRSVPDLEHGGLSVRVPNWWRKRQRPQVSVTIGSTTPPRVGADAVLDFNVEVALGDSPVSAEELEALRGAGDGLVLLRNQWVEVDGERLGQAIAHWEALRRSAGGEEISFIEGMRLLAGASADLRQGGPAGAGAARGAGAGGGRPRRAP